MSCARCSTNRPPNTNWSGPVWHTERLKTASSASVSRCSFCSCPTPSLPTTHQQFADIEALLARGHLQRRHHYSLVIIVWLVPATSVRSCARPSGGRPTSTWSSWRSGSVVAFRLLRDADPRLMRQRARPALRLPARNRLRDYNAKILTATLSAIGIVCIATKTRRGRLGPDRRRCRRPAIRGSVCYIFVSILLLTRNQTTH